MKAILFSLFLLTSAVFTSCSFAEDDLHYPVPVERLPNSWIHAYEKDCGLTMTFKPHTDEYICSWRVRNRLELRTDGSAEYTISTPDDPYIQHSTTHVTGSWVFNPEGNVLSILDEKQCTTFSFEVRHVCPESIKLLYGEWAFKDDSR